MKRIITLATMFVLSLTAFAQGYQVKGIVVDPLGPVPPKLSRHLKCLPQSLFPTIPHSSMKWS